MISIILNCYDPTKIQRHMIMACLATIRKFTNQPYVKKILGEIENNFSQANLINKYGMLLPCHQYLTKKDLYYMIKHINSFVRK